MASLSVISLPNTACSLINTPRQPLFLSPRQHVRPLPLPILKFSPIISTRLQPPGAVSTTPVPELEKQGGGSQLANRWREMMGQNNWKGLLDPLDPLLRLELIKYGEFSVCTHEAFIGDTYARNYGVCKFQVSDFFDHMLMPKHAGYDVTKFIYCTSHHEWWPWLIPKPVNPRTWHESNIWIGFIAVSNDETTKKLGRRDICVAWRGTSTTLEWVNDALTQLSPFPSDDEFMTWPDQKIEVESGFLSLYTHKDKSYSSARGLVLTEVKRLINRVYPDEEVSITVTGHSLGGALALLSAYDIVETRRNVRDSTGKAVPICAITYAGPRVGNSKFKERVEKLGLKVLRIVSVHDPVPKVPLLSFPWIWATFWHVGTLLELDSNDSPYLKPVLAWLNLTWWRNVLSWPQLLVESHSLMGYIHLIDGYQGKGKKFESATGRDIALVNLENDFLKEEHLVVPNWRVQCNKSMVRNNEGKWVHKSTLNDFHNN